MEHYAPADRFDASHAWPISILSLFGPVGCSPYGQPIYYTGERERRGVCGFSIFSSAPSILPMNFVTIGPVQLKPTKLKLNKNTAHSHTNVDERRGGELTRARTQTRRAMEGMAPSAWLPTIHERYIDLPIPAHMNWLQLYPLAAKYGGHRALAHTHNITTIHWPLVLVYIDKRNTCIQQAHDHERSNREVNEI